MGSGLGFMGLGLRVDTIHMGFVLVRMERVWVLMGLDFLRVYMREEGLVRFTY